VQLNRRLVRLLLLAAFFALGQSHASETVTYPFSGIRHTDRTEASPRPLRIHVITIELTNPAIHFLVTPQSGPRDTIIQTTRQFLSARSAQLAVNAHFFTPFPDDGTGTTWLVGLAASSATTGPYGHAYAPFERNLGGAFQNDLPALNLAADNTATIVLQAASDLTGYATDPPVALYNAVSGNEQLLSNGVNVSGTTTFDFTLNPRTAIGIAPGNRLIVLTVDGRQPGISEGMTTAELANLLSTDYGVMDAINLDGGGSTTLVMADPQLRVVNVPVGVNNVPGSERLVGSSLAVFASACPPGAQSTPCGDVAVSAEGSRHLAVTPPPGLASLALKIEAAGVSCFPRYVNASGGLSALPVYQSSAQWGTVHVGHRSIVPAKSYSVTAELPGGEAIGSGSATTNVWGDVNGRDGVDVFDIVCVMDGSQGLTRCGANADDQTAGAPDNVIDLDDVMAVLEAFSGIPYPDVDPCP
jgi:hypothetical protein